MKPKESPLKLRNFYTLESLIQTVFPKATEEQVDIDTTDEQIPFVPDLDLNFDILDNPANQEEFAIKLTIKTKKATYFLPGYKFKITIVGEFYLQDRQNLKPERHTQYVFFSALPMIISIARGEIATLTSKSMFGFYYLPSIYLPDIVEKWFEKYGK